jgi:hypothetical protein
MTGDWGGARNDLAAKGLSFDTNVTQIEQGVVSGGKNGAWEYGGRGDLTFHLDTQKLGLWPGGFLTVELEGNWSDSVNGKTGALVPVNTNQLFPLPTGNNVALPAWNFAQFLSRYAGVTVGKFQTVSGGDMNEFAHGKGDTQFFNTALNVNPALLVVPYSTLGAGAIVLPTADLDQALLTASVLSATGKASTAGFDQLDGPILAGEGRVRTARCIRGSAIPRSISASGSSSRIVRWCHEPEPGRSTTTSTSIFTNPIRARIREWVCLAGSAPLGAIRFRCNTSIALVSAARAPSNAGPSIKPASGTFIRASTTLPSSYPSPRGNSCETSGASRSTTTSRSHRGCC